MLGQLCQRQYGFDDVGGCNWPILTADVALSFGSVYYSYLLLWFLTPRVKTLVNFDKLYKIFFFN